MLTLIRGGFQSGKTALLVERVRADIAGGGEPLVMVPSRSQKEILVRRIAGSGGCSGKTVFTLQEAVSEAMARTAVQDAAPSHSVTDFESFILFTLVFEKCRPQLSFFGDVPAGSGNIPLLFSVITQLRSARVPSEPAAGPSRGPKWADIRTLREAFERRFADAGLTDSHEIQARAASRAGAFAEKTLLGLDGFHDFTASQWEFVRSLASFFLQSGKPVLAAFPDGPSGAISETVRKFSEAFPCETVRTGRPGTADLAGAFLQNEVLEASARKPVLATISAFGTHRETELVANEIRRLVQDEGYRYSEIALIHPSPERYADAVRASCSAMDIPVYSGKDDPLRSSPVILFLYSVLQSVLQKGSIDTVGILSLVRSAYVAGEKYKPVAGLARLLDAYFEGNASAWCGEIDARIAFTRELRAREFLGEDGGGDLSADELTARIARLETLRPVLKSFLDRLFALPEEFTLDDFLQWLSGLIADFGIPETLTDVSGVPAAMDFTALRKLNDVLFALKKTLAVFGRTSFRRAEFFRLFDGLTGAVTYRWQPLVSDSVRFLSPSDARETSFRAVFILGLNEGEFPGRPGLSLLDGAEKKSFNDLARAVIFEDEDARRESDRLSYALAVSRARERLYLCLTPADENGTEILPSLYLLQTLKAAGLPDDAEAVRRLKSFPEELIPSMRWTSVHDRRTVATNDADLLAPKDRSALAREFPFLEYAARMSAQGEERERVNAAFENGEGTVSPPRSVQFGDLDFANPSPLNADNRAAVRDKIAKSRVSSSFLETLGNCRYRFFLRYILTVPEENEPTQDIRSSFKGLFYHAVLRDYVTETLDVPGEAILASPEKYDALLDGILDREYREFLNREGEKDLFTLEKEYFRSVLKKFIRFDAEHLRDGARPAEIEKPVDGPLELGPGQSVPLTGRLDRVDRLDGGDRVRIIDYKSGSVARYKHDFRIPLKLFQGFVYARATGRPVGGVSYVSVENNNRDDRLAAVFPYTSKTVTLSDFSAIWDQKAREILWLFDEMDRGCFSPFTVLSDYPEDLVAFYRGLKKDGRAPDAESDRKCSGCPYAEACPRRDKPVGWE